jgi:hypothetical protein
MPIAITRSRLTIINNNWIYREIIMKKSRLIGTVCACVAAFIQPVKLPNLASPKPLFLVLAAALLPTAAADAAQIHFLYTSTIENLDTPGSSFAGETSSLLGTLAVGIDDPYGSTTLTAADVVAWSFSSRFFGFDSESLDALDGFDFSADYQYDAARSLPVLNIHELTITRAITALSEVLSPTIFQTMGSRLSLHIAGNDVTSGFWQHTTWIVDGDFVNMTNPFADFAQTAGATPQVIGSFLPTTIPLPAAAWLFGTGLLGLIGIARRKKAA